MTLNTVSVLVADDAPAIRDRIVALLEDLPSVRDVQVARDGDETIETLKRYTPDLVILDIRMPKRGGFDVLELMKAVSPATRAIVCTNYPYAQYRARAAELGALHFVDKGKDLSSIRALVAGLASGSAV